MTLSGLPPDVLEERGELGLRAEIREHRIAEWRAVLHFEDLEVTRRRVEPLRRRHAEAAVVHAGDARRALAITAATYQVGELELPIPGFYILDSGGKVLGKCGLGSVEDVLALLRDHTRP